MVGLDPPHAFLLCHQVTEDATSCPGTWQFVLEPIGQDVTRLILRQRSGDSPTGWFDTLAEPGYFVMTRGMLLGLKQRAEAAAARPRPAPA